MQRRRAFHSVQPNGGPTGLGGVEFETLLGDISARLVAVGRDNVEEAVASALEAVRRFFRADRCALCSVSDDLETAHFSHIVQTEDASSHLGDLNLALLLPWSRQRVVVERTPLALARLADLPPEAAADRATFEARGTRAILCIPIQTGPKRLELFLISVVREEREWPEEYVPLLRLLGEMLVNTLERVRSTERASVRAIRWVPGIDAAEPLLATPNCAMCQETTRLAAAVDAAELGFMEQAPETDGLYLDSRARELLGAYVEDADKTRELWLARIDAESRPVVMEKRRQLLTGEIARGTTEYRYDHPRRGAIWLRNSWRRVERDGGHGVRVIGTLEDVTERRQALEDVQRLRERLERENMYLRQEARRRLGTEGIVGRGVAIRRTLDLADQVAVTDSTVLLLGETGSGKERLASYIHERSRRSDRPMIRVSCSAIPTTLIESELFGREKGAYTGALSKQVGRFEMAHGSTLFLDEIGELPVEVQVKLLRVLENRTIERLGNPKPIPVDVRIIAATNRDLAGAIRDGRFRKDLYYRLNVFPIAIPPLSERQEDIPLFIQAFVDEFAGTMGKRIERVDPASAAALLAYAWPGNVRELRNVIERAMIMATGPVLRIDVPETDAGEAASRADSADDERTNTLRVLHDTGWRVRGARGAAARLGLKPTTLESRMKKLGLTRPGIETQLD